MRKIGVITDSYSGISMAEAMELEIAVLPMPFYYEEECFYEGVSITREAFFEKLNTGCKVTTSQGSPAEIMELWRSELKKYEQVLFIPLSSGLSGACQTAIMLSQEEEFENKVFVVNNNRISVPMYRSVLDALELIDEGYSAEQVKEILEREKDNAVIYIAVETLEFLKKGGRISASSATIGTALNIKPILKCETESLYAYKKCRGLKKARKEMLEAMKNDLEVTFKEYAERGEVYLMAATSADEETTKEWVEEIKNYFPGMDVICTPLTLGIACHTGEGALGIGCSTRPKRIH
ncbi:MAG: DegV family protein [Lachnospiraceae bacterium]|nr:DegV family protein [Lachnospiraceae bacterium]